MKRKLSHIVISLFSISLVAQTVTISEPYDIHNDNALEIIGQIESNILLYSSNKINHKIQSYNDKMQKSWDKEIKLEDKRVSVIEIIPRKDDFIMLYQYKRKGDVFFSAARFDAAAELQDSSIVHDFGFTLHQKKFNVEISENKRYALIYHFESFSSMAAMAVDLDSLEMVWNEPILIKDLPVQRDYANLLITNEGRMYYALGIENRKSKSKKHRYEIMTFGIGDQRIKEYTQSMQGNLTYDVKTIFDNLNNNLLITGIYSEKSLMRGNGYFLMTVDGDNPDQANLAFSPFNIEMIAAVEEKRRKKKLKGLLDIEIQEIILRRDGGILLVMEQIKKYERNYGTNSTSANQQIRTFDFSYEDIILQSIHPDGTSHWYNVLPKKQYSADDDGSYASFFSLKTPRNLRFIYNDEIKRDVNVSEYIVFGNGDHKRNSVMSTDALDLRLHFPDAMQVSSTDLLVPSIDKGKLKLIRISY